MKHVSAPFGTRAKLHSKKEAAVPFLLSAVAFFHAAVPFLARGSSVFAHSKSVFFTLHDPHKPAKPGDISKTSPEDRSRYTFQREKLSRKKEPITLSAIRRKHSSRQGRLSCCRWSIIAGLQRSEISCMTRRCMILFHASVRRIIDSHLTI